MRDAIVAAGGDPAAFAGEARAADDLLGYVELHIEQGPVLESRDAHVGVVSAIAGRTRARLELVGRAGHAGTVPMSLRHDPLVVAARIVERVDAIARGSEGVVATVGELTVEPGAANVIPGRVTLSIDVRAPDDDARLAAWETIGDRINRLAQEGGVEARALELEHTPAVACDPRLRALLASAASARGVDAPTLMSGAGPRRGRSSPRSHRSRCCSCARPAASATTRTSRCASRTSRSRSTCSRSSCARSRWRRAPDDLRPRDPGRHARDARGSRQPAISASTEA